MYAKKTRPAPLMMPETPNGAKGCQFAGLTWPIPMTMKNSTTASLMVTMILLTVLLSCVPRMSSAVMSKMMRAAGKLMTPPSKGFVASALGRCSPNVALRKSEKYPDQPMATVAAPSAYSRMSPQPTIQAINSPSVAYTYVYALPETGTLDANSA